MTAVAIGIAPSLVISLAMSATPAPETDPPICEINPDHLECKSGRDALLDADYLASQADEPVPWEGPGPPPASLWYIFQAVPHCTDNTPGPPETRRWADCDMSLNFCDTHDPPTAGPYSRVYRQPTTADGPAGPWEPLGFTCFAGAIPDQSNLTEAMLIEQFHRTDFAPPRLSAQPPDGQTLVNIPTYFAISWGEGFGPGDIDSSTLINHDVQIRPTLDEVTYHYGDGNDSGPTTSLGGTYPDGDITHTYTAGEHVAPRATITYGGEVSVNGEEWFTLPATVDITGPNMDLHVRTSTNRLIPNPGDN